MGGEWKEDGIYAYSSSYSSSKMIVGPTPPRPVGVGHSCSMNFRLIVFLQPRPRGYWAFRSEIMAVMDSIRTHDRVLGWVGYVRSELMAVPL